MVTKLLQGEVWFLQMSRVLARQPATLPVPERRWPRRRKCQQMRDILLVWVIPCLVALLGAMLVWQQQISRRVGYHDSSLLTDQPHPADPSPATHHYHLITNTHLPTSLLHELYWLENTTNTLLSGDEQRVLSEIEGKATLHVRYMVLPEVIYAVEKRMALYTHIQDQIMAAENVVTAKQGEAILRLVSSGVEQGSLMNKEVGGDGSLRNSMVWAVMRESDNSVHFAMVAISVEPKLGWKWISKKQRNAWNAVLFKVLAAKFRDGIGRLLDSPDDGSSTAAAAAAAAAPEINPAAENHDLHSILDTIAHHDILFPV